MGGIICGSNLVAEPEAMRMALMACVELGFKLV